MFPNPYFGPTYYPAPYWPKLGEGILVPPVPAPRIIVNNDTERLAVNIENSRLTVELEQ